MNQFIQAKVLKADLQAIDKIFTEDGVGGMNSMLVIKQSLISIANFFDFECSVRCLYQDYPNLSEYYKEFQKECEFGKYLRNKFVGHLKQELIDKAIEWNPEIRIFVSEMDDSNIAYLINILILETAINTYVNNEGEHKLFDSETDLNYPPDNVRFLKFLTKIIRSSIEYLNKYLAIKDEQISHEIVNVSDNDKILEYALKAGKTEFKFIKK